MTIDRGTIVLGVGKQAEKGTIAANPVYTFGASAGGLKIDPEHAPIELSAGNRARYGVYRNGVAEGADFSTAAFPGSVGDFLLGVLGDVDTTGASAPYTHVFTVGASSPWYTFFEKIDSVIMGIKDCRIDAVEFSWEGNNPLMVHVTANGLTWSRPATFTPTTDEIDATTYLTPVGGTFALDVDSATPATASVTAGSVKFLANNDAPVRFSGSLEGGDIDNGWVSGEVSLTVRPADLTEWLAIITGTTTGTAVSADTVAGSFDVKFVSGTTSLQFVGSNVDYLFSLPEANGSYATWETDLAGVCYMPAADTSPIVATLINTIATY